MYNGFNWLCDCCCYRNINLEAPFVSMSCHSSSYINFKWVESIVKCQLPTIYMWRSFDLLLWCNRSALERLKQWAEASCCVGLERQGVFFFFFLVFSSFQYIYYIYCLLSSSFSFPLLLPTTVDANGQIERKRVKKNNRGEACCGNPGIATCLCNDLRKCLSYLHYTPKWLLKINCSSS